MFCDIPEGGCQLSRDYLVQLWGSGGLRATFGLCIVMWYKYIYKGELYTHLHIKIVKYCFWMILAT